MILNVSIDEQHIPVNVPDNLLQEAEEFFTKMDQDMDKGWQMHRDWVDNPHLLGRCQIVADKLLTAVINKNAHMMALMAGYILTRLPGVISTDIDTSGNMQETHFYDELGNTMI